jgi:hypothetical protein
LVQEVQTPSSPKKKKRWLTPVILATWDGEIKRIEVFETSLGKIFRRPLSQPIKKAGCGGMYLS